MRLGWPGIVLLAAAFGVSKAGVIDQSLFSSNYRGISYWEDQFRPTLVEPLGPSAFQSLAFVAGHVMWNMATPTAIVESLRSPPVSVGMTVVGLVIDPLGAMTTAQKYGHHAVAFVLVVLLAWWGSNAYGRWTRQAVQART